jgi:hypothetical protein
MILDRVKVGEIDLRRIGAIKGAAPSETLMRMSFNDQIWRKNFILAGLPP